MYRMKRSVQFNEYVSIVFEKYILNLIETRPAVNNRSISLHIYFSNMNIFYKGLASAFDVVGSIDGAISLVRPCRLVWTRLSPFGRLYYRQGNSIIHNSWYECLFPSLYFVHLFIKKCGLCAGTVIFAATVTFAAMTRYYLVSVLKKRGLDGIPDYASFLQVIIRTFQKLINLPEM